MHCAWPFCWIFNRISDGVQCCECELVSCFHKVQPKELLVHLCPAFSQPAGVRVVVGNTTASQACRSWTHHAPTHPPWPIIPPLSVLSMVQWALAINTPSLPPPPPRHPPLPTVISLQAFSLSPSCNWHPQVESVWLRIHCKYHSFHRTYSAHCIVSPTTLTTTPTPLSMHTCCHTRTCTHIHMHSNYSVV